MPNNTVAARRVRLRDLQVKHALTRQGVYLQTAVDEFTAIMCLAALTFGPSTSPRGGIVQLYDGGLIAIGHYVDPIVPGVPDVKRRRVMRFVGVSHKELAEQVAFWKASQ